jgi:nucleoid-associated protein YgaU
MIKDKRVILIAAIIAVLAMMLIFGNSKQADPVNFDKDPLAEGIQAPVEISRQQQEFIPQAIPVVEEPVTEAPTGEAVMEEVLLPEEGVNPDLPLESPQAVAPVTYTVKSGDTLSKIAYRQLGSARKWSDIFAANKKVLNNNPAALKVGMKLVLPGAPAEATVSTSAPAAEAESVQLSSQAQETATTITYTVKKDDSLYKIATKLYGKGTAWQQILDANKTLLGDNGSSLAIGQVLTIPPLAEKSTAKKPQQLSEQKKEVKKEISTPTSAVEPDIDMKQEEGIDESIFNFEKRVPLP